MEQLQEVFDYQGQKVRTIIKNEKPWFVAKDICDILEYSNHNQILKRLAEDEKGVNSIDTPGGIQNVTVVNEPGLYHLVLGSKKKKAKEFKRWIIHEVLPEIRKTGSYSVKPKSQLDILRGALDEIEKAQKQAQEAKKIATETKKETENIKESFANLDAVNLEGDLRQRLNKMVRKYAFRNGVYFDEAWNTFKKNFNTAYRTNIELLKTNYFKKTGREVSTPKILEKKDLLEDAIRVADKMLNSQSA